MIFSHFYHFESYCEIQTSSKDNSYWIQLKDELNNEVLLFLNLEQQLRLAESIYIHHQKLFKSYMEDGEKNISHQAL